MKSLLSALFWVLLPVSSFAQLGGENAFRFLTTTSSARVAASGGFGFANPSNDLHFALMNPAHLRPDLSGQLGLSFATLPAGIRFAEGGYVQDFGKVGTFSTMMKYIGYGD
ncbi:MAG: hypothetical protein LPK28_00465, partial [Bacteroidota bacterium]|nr:hypothetical protein [Bacteroidota bacterium]